MREIIGFLVLAGALHLFFNIGAPIVDNWELRQKKAVVVCGTEIKASANKITKNEGSIVYFLTNVDSNLTKTVTEQTIYGSCKIVESK